MSLMLHWKTINRYLAPADEGTPPAEPTPAVPTPAEPAAEPEGPDYSWLPEQYRGEAEPDLTGFRTHYDDIMAEKAIRDEALAEVPEDGRYEFAMPEALDFGEMQLPEDFAVDLKTDDPALAPLFDELGSVMKKHNMPKSAAGEMMGLIAKYEAAKFSKFFTEESESLKQMGAAAGNRRESVIRLLEAKLPAPLAQKVAVLTASADGIRALESLLKPRGMPSPNPTPTPAADDEQARYAARYPKSA